MPSKPVPVLWSLFFLLSVALPAAEQAPPFLPSPLVLHVTTANPERLMVLADKLTRAILEGTQHQKGYQPGLFPSLAKSLNIPSLFANPRALFGMAVGIDRNHNTDGAFFLQGVDKDTLLGELENAGITCSDKKGAVRIDLSAIRGGLELYLVEGADYRLVLGDTPQSARKYAGVFKRFHPPHPEDVDIRAVVNTKRLRDLYPEDIEEYVGKIDGMTREELEETVFRETTPALRGKFSQAMSETIRRFALLPLEVDAVGLDLLVDDDLLFLSCILGVGKKGALSRLSMEYADRDNPNYTLDHTVSDDAVLLTASSPAEGGMFEEGGISATIAAIFCEALTPENADAARELRREFRDNAVREEVSGYYAWEESLARVTFTRSDNGKRHVELLLDTAELANAVLAEMNAAASKGFALNLTMDAGKTGNIAYKRVIPECRLEEREPVLESFQAAVNRIRSYLTSKGKVTMIVSGFGIEPGVLAKETARYQPGIDNALMEHQAARDLVNRMSLRQIGHSLFKPSDLFVYLAWFRLSTGLLQSLDDSFDPDTFLESLQNGGDLAGCSFGAVPGGLSFQLAMPLEAINDLFVNVEKEQAVASASSSFGVSRDGGEGDTDGWAGGDGNDGGSEGWGD